MSKFWDTKEFKDLNNTWKKKLKKSGFDDVEQADGNLKRWDSHFFIVHHNPTLYHAKEAYYRYANQFLHEHKFETRLEKFIWEKHAAGISLQDIVKAIKKTKMKAALEKVWLLTQKMTKLMKQKYDIKGAS